MPYHVDAFDKISLLHTPTIVLTDNPDRPESVSVLSVPYETPSGGRIGVVDLFVNNEQEMRRHLGEQLKLVADIMR